MNLADYQTKARSTAVPLAYEYRYLMPGLLGELGELTGRQAKGFWKGDVGTAAYLVDIAYEYGDIAWMTAILLSKQHIHGRDAWGHPYGSAARGNMTPLGEIAFEVSVMFTQYSAGPCFFIDARPLWDLLERHCEAITGRSFSEVLEMNLSKLASRAARGVLIGNGDHR